MYGACSKMWGRIGFFMLLAITFAGCTAKFYPPNLQNFSQKEFVLSSQNQNLRLIVSHMDESYRFALFDALGAPLADKELRDGEFKSLKFLLPNSSYDELFMDVLAIVQNGAKTGVIKTKKETFEVRYVY